MSLLDRARARRQELDDQHGTRAAQRDRQERHELLPYITRVLEVDDGRVTADDLSIVHAERYGTERALYQFDLEGHHFIIGDYWHGQPGGRTLLAVQVQAVRGRPEWPPPEPATASSLRWAPTGYIAIQQLADLADALEAAKPTPSKRPKRGKASQQTTLDSGEGTAAGRDERGGA